MMFNLIRHVPTQMYYWKENEHDKLVDMEFISFQGCIEGIEIRKDKQYVILGIGSIIHYRMQGRHLPVEIRGRESHLIEILGDDDITLGPDMVLNTLNPNPIQIVKLLPPSKEPITEAI